MASTFSAFAAGVTAGAIGALAYARWRRPTSPTTEESAMPAESTIRLMTRLALKHEAVNLSQGFPDEPPPVDMVAHAAAALMDGSSIEAARKLAGQLLPQVHRAREMSGGKDLLNQYSFPAGMPILRSRVAGQCQRHFPPELQLTADDNVTIVLGATEGFAVRPRLPPPQSTSPLSRAHGSGLLMPPTHRRVGLLASVVQAG